MILPNDGQHMDLVSAWYDVLRGDVNAELIQAIKDNMARGPNQIGPESPGSSQEPRASEACSQPKELDQSKHS